MTSWTSIIFRLLPLVAISMAHPYLSCNCGLGPGEDMCLGGGPGDHPGHHHHGKCTPLVVRPVDIPKPPALPTPKVVCAPVGGITPLVPVDSPCDCRTSLVKPAVVPKPACTACSGGVEMINNQHLTLSQKQQLLFGGSDGVLVETPVRPIVVDDITKTPANPANYVPADPVSLHVAYKLAQESCDHSEDKLSFGFRSIPKELPSYVKRVGIAVPEENLYNLNGEIVELKKKKCTTTSTKTLDEEARDQLLQLAEEEEDAKINSYDNVVKHISLGELGYGPAKIKEPIFINIKSDFQGPDDGLASNVRNCDDGFKPGNVIISQVPKSEHLSLPPSLPEPCPPDVEPLIPPPPAVPPCALYNNPYTILSSSSSSASSANLYKKSVFLQKIGCS